MEELGKVDYAPLDKQCANVHALCVMQWALYFYRVIFKTVASRKHNIKNFSKIATTFLFALLNRPEPHPQFTFVDRT